MADRLRWRTWLLRASVVVLLALVVAVLLYPAIRSARRAALRQERANKLRQIGLALWNFQDSYKRLPPAVRTDEAGRPLGSWRFQILPYLEAMMLGIDFADRWDDPANRYLSARPHFIFCWSGDQDTPESLHPNVVAVTGPGTAFDGDRACSLADIDPDTILAIEVADWDCHWMEPGDLRVDQVPESIVRGMDGDGVHVLFADATVWFVASDVPLGELTKFFTIDGAKQWDREQVLGPYRRDP